MTSLTSQALTCVHPSAGLSMSVSVSKEQLSVRIFAGRGYGSLPQIEGPVSPNDLPVLQFQMDYLKKLGELIEFQMPTSSCDLTKFDHGIFSCYKEVDIKGSTFKVQSLTAYSVKQTHVSGDFELQNFRMLIGDENLFFFGVPFAKIHCNYKNLNSISKTKF
jgi:hypothetical protein